MNIKTGIAFSLAAIISPCANALDAFNPVISNMSVLFDFNPARGDIRTLTSRIYNDDGSLDYEMNLLMDRQGCVTAFGAKNVSDKKFTELFRKDHALKGKDERGEVTLTLDDKCRFVTKTDSTGTAKFTYGENGLITSVSSAKTGQTVMTYQYDTFGMLAGVETFMNGKTFLQNRLQCDVAGDKPFDCLSMTRVQGITVATIKMNCDYDDNGLAYQCNMLSVLGRGEKQKLRKQRVSTTVTYYPRTDII
ncbi:YnfC family lipoprotein [Musicola keenii]|uniref:YnfC family lipoprotein n=1 Tax=Musicola keenii TaxID=2884250 RepID=UPI0017809866|nr:YnfC family lipoprotein [Musicola keenii]